MRPAASGLRRSSRPRLVWRALIFNQRLNFFPLGRRSHDLPFQADVGLIRVGGDLAEVLAQGGERVGGPIAEIFVVGVAGGILELGDGVLMSCRLLAEVFLVKIAAAEFVERIDHGMLIVGQADGIEGETFLLGEVFQLGVGLGVIVNHVLGDHFYMIVAGLDEGRLAGLHFIHATSGGIADESAVSDGKIGGGQFVIGSVKQARAAIGDGLGILILDRRYSANSSWWCHFWRCRR